MTLEYEIDPNFDFQMEVRDEHGFETGQCLLSQVDALPHVQFVKQFVQALGTPIRGCALTEPERDILRRGGSSMAQALQERLIDRWHETSFDIAPEASENLIAHGFDHRLIEGWTGGPVILSDDYGFASHFGRYLVRSTPGDLQWLVSVRRRALSDLLACDALDVLRGDRHERRRSFLQAGPMGVR